MNDQTALYCRSALKDGAAIAAQEEELLRFAERNGCGKCARYRDNGQSGATRNRPGLNALMNDVRAGKIKTVIAKDTARFARNLATFAELTNEAEMCGVSLVTVDGGTIAPKPEDWTRRIIPKGA
jgi:DNA invertase Pin-like site-specific DNA recombinase